MGLIHRSGRSPGGGYGNQLQYSCLENPVNRGAYSLWGHKELGMTEATMHVSMHRAPSWCYRIVAYAKDPLPLQRHTHSHYN